MRPVKIAQPQPYQIMNGFAGPVRQLHPFVVHDFQIRFRRRQIVRMNIGEAAEVVQVGHQVFLFRIQKTLVEIPSAHLSCVKAASNSAYCFCSSINSIWRRIAIGAAGMPFASCIARS